MANVVIKVPVPAFWQKLRKRASSAFSRATVWLDENNDWFWMPIAAAFMLWLALKIVSCAPPPQVWR